MDNAGRSPLPAWWPKACRFEGVPMNDAEHENYAEKLLSSISDDQPETGGVTFTPNHSQSRNAAHAMTAILCHRLFKKSGEQPKRIRSNTYAWNEGVVNNRNIADRDYLWSNMRRNVADTIHETAVKKPVAYLLAFSSPTDTTLNVWSIPEPILHKSLSNLPLKESGQEYTLQISTNKQRIANDVTSPDLTAYFRKSSLSPRELLVLRQSREVDAAVSESRAMARGKLDTPEITHLKQELDDLQSRPQTPDALREVQRVLKTYERPSLITKYVKRTRGATCQLCGELGFVKRNGERYCEIHHLFHLSKAPPPKCLGPNFIVILCATCHRRLHYADVGEPIRDGTGWRIRIDETEHRVVTG
jgi:5-methylcytosine-specific restriction endonuclease McrA